MLTDELIRKLELLFNLEVRVLADGHEYVVDRVHDDNGVVMIETRPL